MERQPTYYAIIPANVRYDKSIPMGAKMMYGEITALSNANGFCFASNGYFSELYGVTKQAISKWIKQLEAAGYVSVAYVDNNGIQQRRVSIAVEGYQPQLRGVSTPVDHNNTRKNNNSLYSENEFSSCGHKVTEALSVLTALIETDRTVLGPLAAEAKNLERELEKWLRYYVEDTSLFGNLKESLQFGKHSFELWLARGNEFKESKAAEREAKKGYTEGTPYGDYRKKVEDQYPKLGNRKDILFTEEEYNIVNSHIKKMSQDHQLKAVKAIWETHKVFNDNPNKPDRKYTNVFTLANTKFFSAGLEQYGEKFVPMAT